DDPPVEPRHLERDGTEAGGERDHLARQALALHRRPPHADRARLLKERGGEVIDARRLTEHGHHDARTAALHDHRRQENVERTRAPVSIAGQPRSSSAVPGAGTGIRPCGPSTKPEPTGSADACTAVASSIVRPSAAPAISTIASTAPTSWKCTASRVEPCARA